MAAKPNQDLYAQVGVRVRRIRDAVEGAISDLVRLRGSLTEEEGDGLTLTADDVLAEAAADLDEMLDKINVVVADLERVIEARPGGTGGTGA